jgi:hypothetical protein
MVKSKGIKYDQSKIYKIISDQSEMIYVGSTTKQYLSQRMDKHRNGFKNWKEGKGSFVASYEILKYDDAKIILLENCNCKSRDELIAREQFYIDKYKDICINKHFAKGRNIEKRRETQNEYRKNNIEQERERDRKRYEKDKEKRIALSKNRYEVKKNQINEYRRDKIFCECGVAVARGSIHRHKKSKGHINYINDPEYIPNKPLFSKPNI